VDGKVDRVTNPDLSGWIPVKISRYSAEPVVEWCHFGARRFTESFFDHTVQQAMRTPFNLVFRHQTSLDALLDWQTLSPGLEPSGFIFHMSRCGSTLVAQMLAALPEHIVISEAPPLDAILRMDVRGASDEQRINWLRGWMSAVGQPRNGEKHLFVKFDAWHTFDIPILRRAFPHTPWIFLHRNPVEVMASVLKDPGARLIPGLPGNEVPSIDPVTAVNMPQAEYCARALAAVCKAGLEHLKPSDGKPIDYADLPAAFYSQIAPLYHLNLASGDIEKMHAVTAFHAKTPRSVFEPDSQVKQQEVTTETRELCAHLLDPLYAQLKQSAPSADTLE